LGLILPILSLVVAVLYELFIVFSAVYIADEVVWSILGAVASLVVLNVPALVYYIIYRTMKKKAQEADVNRMKINDLE
jgi:prepilin signal peptidase PulO-like enzyme (type II secretory pathway)